MNGWNELAKFVEENHDTDVDWDEEFFICPECGEPIYAEDWSNNDDIALGMCPICGMYLNENVSIIDTIETIVKRYTRNNVVVLYNDCDTNNLKEALCACLAKNDNIISYTTDSKTFTNARYAQVGVVVVSWYDTDKNIGMKIIPVGIF
jgi:NAD-dependent SIR2 family protein deacetylase